MFGEHADATARLHALYALEGMNSLDPKVVMKGLRDQHPGVREHALILSEKYAQLLPELLNSTNDSVLQVSFQATLSLGQFSGKKVIDAFATVVEKHAEDPFFRTAVLSAPASLSVELLNTLRKNKSFETHSAGKELFVEEFAYAMGSVNKPQQIVSLLEFFERSDGEQWRSAALKGLTTALKKIKDPDPRLATALAATVTNTSEETDRALANLKAVFKGAN
jgi:hypothetical protein